MIEKKFSPATEAFYRKRILPEEDRRDRLGVEWKGGYRWFKSPNVVPIEHYRRQLEPVPQQKASQN
jgi:hypothetical protein